MAISCHDLPREEMADTRLDDKVPVIHVFRRCVESCADIVTRKAG
jgi:hypothetical protein